MKRWEISSHKSFRTHMRKPLKESYQNSIWRQWISQSLYSFEMTSSHVISNACEKSIKSTSSPHPSPHGEGDLAPRNWKSHKSHLSGGDLGEVEEVAIGRRRFFYKKLVISNTVRIHFHTFNNPSAFGSSPHREQNISLVFPPVREGNHVVVEDLYHFSPLRGDESRVWYLQQVICQEKRRVIIFISTGIEEATSKIIQPEKRTPRLFIVRKPKTSNRIYYSTKQIYLFYFAWDI